MLIEQDQARIVSGVRHGYTLGSPIGMTVENKDWVNWQESMAVGPLDPDSADGSIERVTRLRPGHADLAGAMKYGFEDVRNVLERASARETAARVAAGAIALRFLEEFDIRLRSHVISIGGRVGGRLGPHRLGSRGGIAGAVRRPGGSRQDDGGDRRRQRGWRHCGRHC